MVAIDATMLMLLLQPHANVPNGPDGQPVERAAERVTRFVADFSGQHGSIIIPAPALAEVLVRVDPAASL